MTDTIYLSTDYMDRVFSKEYTGYTESEYWNNRKKSARKLKEMFKGLDAFTYMVYQYYYHEGMTQQKIADLFGVSRFPIRRALMAIKKPP